MNHYIKDRNGREHIIEEYGWENGIVTLCIDNWKIVNLKMYFRYPKTLNDYMGNTSCGYYANVPITRTEHKRVYLYLNR